jgi:hypothetical protein
MSWSQLRSPNLATVGNLGWCLAFVETAFNTPHLYPTALAAWENAGGRHEDENFPEGMYVPIYFTYENAGHIAIHKPDGTILSSPWEQGTHQATLPNIAELIRIYSDNGVHHMNYLGWSESLAGMQLVEYTAPAPVAPPFTVDIQPFSGQFIVRGNKWNLTLPNFNAIAGSPLASPPNVPVTFTAQLKRSDLPQYTYYLEDGNVHEGYNSLDCIPYTPPPPPVYMAPAGALKVTKAETYTLLTALPYYASSDDCQKAVNSTGTLPAGTYYVWEKGGSNSIYYNLTSDNTKNLNHFVNILDNKVPVVKPLPPSQPVVAVVSQQPNESEIRASYRDILSSGGPVEMQTTQPLLVMDYAKRGRSIEVPRKTMLQIFGTFRINDQYYAMPKVKLTNDNANAFLYGIPIAGPTNFNPYLEDIFGVPESIRYGVRVIYEKIGATLEGIWHPKKG